LGRDPLEHDPEKWIPVFGKDHAQAKNQGEMAIQRNPFRLSAAENNAARCAACRFFTGAPAALERALPGVNILSSAYGSVRADTGLCERHGAFTTARTAACPEFDKPRPQEAAG
jgi:hypothetical protein